MYMDDSCTTTRRQGSYPKGPEHHNYKQDRSAVVDTGYKTPCHIWKLAKNNYGYGLVRHGPGNMKLAHKVAYEEKYGAVRDGMTLDHLCKVRSCINPDHLEEVTMVENIHRGASTRLTPDDVRQIRSSPEKQKVLAKQHGISQSHVSRVKRRKSWCDLP